MFDLDSWQEIWATISKNKLRSALTGFGVFWGIFMLVILIGVGNGLSVGMFENVGGIASNSSIYWSNRTSEAYKGYRKGRWWNVTNKDLNLIKEKAKTVEYISPILFGGGSDKNVVRGQKSGSYGLRGIYPDHYHVEGQYILQGRTLNYLDIEQKKKVCVIGKMVYETLFEKGEIAEGQYIRVDGIYFQVIGVVSPKANIPFMGRVEELVYLPFSTMQTAFNHGDVIHLLSCTTKPGYPVTVTEDEVKGILRTANNISPTDEKAVRSENIEKVFQMFQGLFFGIDSLIWLVGLGALFSGIIGISNIMLVTVRERTREIGVRRALGAKPMAIMIQILSESFVLTSIAGMLGFLVGIATLEGVNSALADEFAESRIFVPLFVTFNVAIVSMIILILSGLLAGVMPALRALKVKAIDAIRDE